MSVELIGEDKLRRAFAGLPDLYTDSLMQKANAKAAEPLVHKMHRLAPVGLTGNLAESIGIVKAGKKNSGELGQIQVGPRRKGGKKGWVAHLVEFGTKGRRTKSTNANRGVMPADPFVEPSFEQTVNEVKGRQLKELERVTVSFLRRVVA